MEYKAYYIEAWTSSRREEVAIYMPVTDEDDQFVIETEDVRPTLIEMQV